jgi:ABC-type glycerol-3-phosphate transport system substrate-binding protein
VHTIRRPALATALPVAAVLALLAAGCTAGTSQQPAKGPAATEQQTITIWHGFGSSANEVNAFNKMLSLFHAAHPNITVKAVSGQDDDKITAGIRAGNPPDVAVSFTTDNVGKFCQSGAFQDLAPSIGRDKVDMSQFPKAVSDYTQFRGKRCALPLLADVTGLYYNKKLLAAAGYSSPPKTMSELAAMAKKLTVRNPDGSLKTVGFMPTEEYYENTPQNYAPAFGATWLTPDGKSNLAADPAWSAYLRWQKDLVDWYGYNNVVKFQRSLGDEFEAQNPFQVGKVAMAIDGEWRTAMIAEQAPKLDYGTAPVPVSDDRADKYGGGYITGTIIGIPRGSKHPDAAWELVKFLTTNTDSLVTLANAIHNVPSTIPALAAAKDLTADEHFRTFVDIFRNPNTRSSPASPNGGAYILTFQTFIQNWEAGRVPDLAAGLAKADKEINDALALGGN